MVTCNIALKAWLRLQGVQLALKIESFNNHVDDFDGTLKHVHNNDNFIPSLFQVQYSGKEFNFKKFAYKTN